MPTPHSCNTTAVSYQRAKTAPSASAQGRAWLENFALKDKGAARLLIDSLRIVSEAEMRLGLLAKLEELVSALPAPMLLLPVRSLTDFAPRSEHARIAVYRDFDPFSDLSAAPGSEAIAANIIRQVAGVRGRNPRILSPESRLDDLRERRCRALLFVDDYAGSGRQSIKYLKSWLRNPTIRSWRSFGWLEVHLLLFASSRFSARRLRASAALDRLHVIETAPDFHNASWSKREIHSVQEFCKKYADPRRLERGEALGFAASGGLLVMQHSVPNNLPAVLLQERGPRGDPWTPLFPGRRFTPSLQGDLIEYRPREEFELDLREVKDRRLASALENESKGSQRPYLMTLAAIAGHSQDQELIADALATSTIRIDEITRSLHAWGLIDAHNRLTDSGWLTLRRTRMRPRKVAFALKGSDEPYYPQQLRGVDGV